MTASSPMITPVLGSPSAVYAKACSESCSNETTFSRVSACDANDFVVLTGGARGDAGELMRLRANDVEQHEVRTRPTHDGGADLG